MKEKVHVVVIPLPAQGHITPMVQLSKRLRSKGVKVTLVSAFIKPDWLQPPAGMAVVDISADAPEPDRDPTNIMDFMEQFRQVVSVKLPQLVEEEKQREPVRCVVYDSTIPWALDIATHLGLKAAPLFTQPCAVFAILYVAHLEAPLDHPKAPLDHLIPSLDHLIPSLDRLGWLPPLGASDLPSFFSDSSSFPAMLALMINQFTNLRQAHCILCNSFDALEPQAVGWLSNQLPLKNIGPTIPSMYLDKRLEDDTDYGVELFQSKGDTCKEWLDSKGDASVVYVAFGSLASMGNKQMEEIALGLRNSERNFVWVVRDTEAKKFPSEFMGERGLVVNWCRQLQVLAHRAVGCFVSHCGWNSTFEAMCLGVPMVGIPQWGDQTTNAKFVADVWQIGLRAKPDHNGTVTRHQIEKCIREVMEGERSREIKANSLKWKQFAKAAIHEGGTSDTNIQQFVDTLEFL